MDDTTPRRGARQKHPGSIGIHTVSPVKSFAYLHVHQSALSGRNSRGRRAGERTKSFYAASRNARQIIRFEPVDLPVISLYLSTQADRRGRARFHSFLRKELKAKSRTYPLRSPARSFDTDVARIKVYLENIRPSANSVVIFACAGSGDFFETVALDAPIDEHRLYVYHQPHLYPLARLSDEFPRYAALIADTNAARIYVGGESLHGRNQKGKCV